MGSGMCYKDDVSSSRGWIEEVCRRAVWAVIVFGAVVVLGLGLLPGRAHAEARVWADSNGDGYDDLAIGVQFENVGSIESAGAVNVIYGSANRLTSTGNQFWSQNSTNILDTAEAYDYFGWSLTAGDFNGDGYDDLAVGVSGEDIGTIALAGAVNVIYGSANKLTSTDNQFWSQNSTNFLDSVEKFDNFGFSLGK